jgi:hypothetical protein
MSEQPPQDVSVDAHWNGVYTTRPTDEVSWFQADPEISLRLINQSCPATPAGSLIDVGAGASTLVDRLLDQGHTDLTVLDVSSEALDLVAARLGERAGQVARICHDLLTWHPTRQFRLWHDRAVFHFLTEPGDRGAYVTLVTRSVEPAGALVLGVFAKDGPTSCSGLPAARYSAAELQDLSPPGSPWSTPNARSTTYQAVTCSPSPGRSCGEGQPEQSPCRSSSRAGSGSSACRSNARAHSVGVREDRNAILLGPLVVREGTFGPALGGTAGAR